MNCLVDTKYDKFERKTTTSLNYLIKPQIIENTSNISDAIISIASVQEDNNRPTFAIYIVGTSDDDFSQTRFLFRLNDEERLSYDGRGLGKSAYTALSEDDFMRICKAETIEMRIEVGDGHLDYTSEEFQIGARVLYNAVIDEGKYLDDVRKVEEEETAKKIKKEKQKQALIDEWNHLKFGPLNKYVVREYDEFQERISISFKEEIKLEDIKTTLLIFNTKLGFRYIIEKGKEPVFLLDITGVTKSGEILDLKSGQLILVAGERRITLQAHESFSKPHLESFHIESDYYEISQDDLKDISDANYLAFRVTNGHQYADLSTDGVQIAARRFYNAVVDNTAYIDDLLTPEERQAAERERIRKEQAAERERIRKEQEAERERLRKEREAKEAEEARIRAERREKWWQENNQKVFVALAIVVVIIIGILLVKFIARQKAEQDAMVAFASGDSCVAVYSFDKAEEYYYKALKFDNSGDIQRIGTSKIKALANAKAKADEEYERELKKLRILLDADDNVFNDYSNACLDKMIKIYPDREETIYYKNLRK